MDFIGCLLNSLYPPLTMELNLRFRKFVTICLFCTLVGIICFGYLCSEIACSFSSSHLRIARIVYQPVSNSLEKVPEPELKFNRTPGLSFDNILNEKIPFDINGHDVMVFLHIQKTGGTSFGRHLVQDLDLQRPCTCQRKQKRCYCFRPNRNENWLFSRYSTGWKCGLHADWTELTNCVDSELDKNENKGELVKRRYFYISLIREPVSRFLSEFKHVQRGATWKNSRHWCGGRVASNKELPKCYSGLTWKNVSLNEFLSCPHNLAANRQARMISDLSLVGCYNKSSMATEERDRMILESAKHNLASMAFFYLTEYQKIGQYLFEEIFNLRFAVPFTQYNSTRSSDYSLRLEPQLLAEIRRVNKLDIELYEFAKSLMLARFKFLSERDPDFEKRWKHLGELSVETEFNWDEEIEPEPSAVKAVNTK